MAAKEDERKFILECIELYKTLPALWNVKSKEYSNRIKKNEQYDRLLHKYRERYPKATKNESVKKFNSLHTNFRKELKRINGSEKSGAGTNDVLEPTLWYFEEMQFLVGDEGACKSLSSMDIGNGEEIATDDHAEESNVVDITEGNSNVDGPPKKRSKTMHNSPKKISSKQCNKKGDTEKLIELVCSNLQKPESEYSKTANAWAVELEKMEPLQQLFAKKAINDILFEGQFGTLHRDSVQINKLPIPTRTSTPLSAPTPSPMAHQQFEELQPRNTQHTSQLNNQSLYFSHHPTTGHSDTAHFFSQFST